MAVGLIGGYLIDRHRNVKLSNTFTRLGWTVFAVLSLSILLGEFIHSRDMGNSWASAEGEAHRPATNILEQGDQGAVES